MFILAYLLNAVVLATVWPQAESRDVFIVKGKFQLKDVTKICAQLSSATFNEENVRMDNCIKSKFNLELLTEWSIPENSTEQIVVQIQDQLNRSGGFISNAHVEAQRLYLVPVLKLELVVDVFEESGERIIEHKLVLDLARFIRLAFWIYVNLDSQSLYYESNDNETYMHVEFDSSHIPKSDVLQSAVQIYQYMQKYFKFPEVYIEYPSPHGTHTHGSTYVTFKPFVYKMTVSDDNTCELLHERLGPLCDVVDCYRYKRNNQSKVIIWAYPEMEVGRPALKKELRSIHEDVEDLTDKCAGYSHSAISIEGIPKEWAEEYYDEASSKGKNTQNTILKTIKVGLPNISMDIYKYAPSVRPYKQIYVVLNFTLAETDDKKLVEKRILETHDLIKNVFARDTKIRFAYYLPKETVTKYVTMKVAFRNRQTREKCAEWIHYQIKHLDKIAEFKTEENDEIIVLTVTLTQPYPSEEKVTQFIKHHVNQHQPTCQMDIELEIHNKIPDASSDANSRSLNVLVFLASIFVLIMTMI